MSRTKKKSVSKSEERRKLVPKNEEQINYIRTMAENQITLVNGVAGCGKGHCAVGLAVQYLIDGRIAKILIARPAVEAGEKIGSLPGSAQEKISGLLIPILDELHKFASRAEIEKWTADGKLEVCAIGYMRGRTFSNSFVIIDEVQNLSFSQIKMVLTRIGEKSKMVLMGDTDQSDLAAKDRGGFLTYLNILQEIPDIGVCTMNEVVRNPLIKHILAAVENYEKSLKK